MRTATVIARLHALPARHKAIAAALAGCVISASCMLPALLPPRYTSFAVLSYHPPAANLAGESNEAAAQAAAILADQTLTDQIRADQIQADQAQADQLDTQPGPPASPAPNSASSLTLAAASKQVRISQISPTELRLTYSGPDVLQARPAVQACVSLLRSWRPHVHSATPEARIQPPAPPKPSDPAQEREQALLRVTIAVFDTRIAELHTLQQEKSADQATLQKQMTQLQSQRKVLEGRLAESNSSASQPGASQPAASSSQSHAPASALESPANTPPFTLIEPATPAQPSPTFTPQMRTYGILAGILAGLLYLTIALWLFRPLQDIAALQKLLPRQIRLVGAIGDLRQ